MGQWQFHTPEGVMDYLPEDCGLKRQLEAKIREVFWRRGYEEIETPGVEFYDVYSGGQQFTPQEQLFKFFDQKGRILCLRYDGTVPTARLAATVCKDTKAPLRFSYLGNMYRFSESGGGKQREFTQAGIELLGARGPEADAEIIATAIESASALGIRDIQVSIGQVGFFTGLVAKWNLSPEQAAQLQRMIDTRETVALEELVSQLQLSHADQKILSLMTEHDGSAEVIPRLRELISYPACTKALDNLSEVLSILDDYGLTSYISVDLGMLQSISYYSGIIFKGFTYGLGFPLFSGGRYDQVVSKFGRDLEATGFSIGLNFVMMALRRQDLVSTTITPVHYLLYKRGNRKAALSLAERLRGLGLRIICDHNEQAGSDFAAGRVLSAGQLKQLLTMEQTDQSVRFVYADNDNVMLLNKGEGTDE